MKKMERNIVKIIMDKLRYNMKKFKYSIKKAQD